MSAEPLQDIPRIIDEARFILPQPLFLQLQVWHCCTKTASRSVAECCQHVVVRVVQKGDGLVFMVQQSIPQRICSAEAPALRTPLLSTEG